MKFFSIFLLLTLTACVYEYVDPKPQYIWPTSTEGRYCANQCVNNKSNCTQMCNLNEQNCNMMYSLHNYEMNSNTMCSNNHRNCTHQCASTYDQCFVNCGGEILYGKYHTTQSIVPYHTPHKKKVCTSCKSETHHYQHTTKHDVNEHRNVNHNVNHHYYHSTTRSAPVAGPTAKVPPVAPLDNNSVVNEAPPIPRPAYESLNPKTPSDVVRNQMSMNNHSNRNSDPVPPPPVNPMPAPEPRLVEPVKVEPKPEPVFEPRPTEPVKVEPKPEPAPEPRPVEPVKVEPKPEPVSEPKEKEGDLNGFSPAPKPGDEFKQPMSSIADPVKPLQE